MKDIEYYKKGFRSASFLAFLLAFFDLFLLYQLAVGVCYMN